jgi:hypothetical protein
VSVLALSAACGSDDPNDPSDPADPADPADPDDPDDPADQVARDYDDTASAVAGSARVTEIAAMLDLNIISHGGMPQDITYVGVDANHFHHATGVRNGVTFDYLYHCNDNADVIVPQCNSAVDHSHIRLKLTGNASGAMAMTGIEHKGTWAVRDIDIVKPRVGGTSTIDFSARVNNADYVFSFDATLDRIRYEPNGQVPMSGKVDFSIMASRTRDGNKRDFTSVASLAFANSTTAMLTIDGSKRYSVDLTTGLATKQ